MGPDLYLSNSPLHVSLRDMGDEFVLHPSGDEHAATSFMVRIASTLPIGCADILYFSACLRKRQRPA